MKRFFRFGATSVIPARWRRWYLWIAATVVPAFYSWLFITAFVPLGWGTCLRITLPYAEAFWEPHKPLGESGAWLSWGQLLVGWSVISITWPQGSRRKLDRLRKSIKQFTALAERSRGGRKLELIKEIEELETEYRDLLEFDKVVPATMIPLSCGIMISLTTSGSVAISHAQFFCICVVTFLQPVVYRATLGFDRQISARLQEIRERYATP